MDAEVASQVAVPAAEEPAAEEPAAVKLQTEGPQQEQQHQQQQDQQQEDQQQGQQNTQHEQNADVKQSQHVSLHEAVEVEIRVSNITRQGLDVLENLLSNWAAWQQQSYGQAYPAELQLLSGKLALDVQQLFRDGVVGWHDTTAPVPGTGQRQQRAEKAAAYEQSEAPPLYDRAIAELLAPPAAAGSGINMLPGGAEATRRRQMAEARLTLDEAGDAAGAATKRRRLPNNRCFNCGSYAHAIAQCPKDFDQDRVAAAKAERNAAGAKPGFNALLRQRYFAGAGGGKGGSASPYEGLQPGAISADLAQALGMDNLSAPPPWIGRMTVLGLPPGWMQREPAGAAAGEPYMTFITGSEDEADADADADAGVEAAAAADPEAADGAQQSGDAAAAAAGTDAVVDDTAAAGGTSASSAAEDGKEEGLAAAVGGVPGQQMSARHLFPGINAPLPDGADVDAWGAELDKAKYVARMLGMVS